MAQARSNDALRDTVQEGRLFTGRTVAAAIVLTLLMTLLGGRLFFLQVVSHSHFSTLSDNNRVRLQPIAPTRGLIYDRNGVLLADNLPSYRLEIVPELAEDLDRTISDLRRLLPLDDDDVQLFHARRKRRPRHEGIPLRLHLLDSEMARVAVNLHRLPGVHLRAGLTRDYPLGPIGVHAIGYVGRISEAELETIDEAQYRGTTHIGKNGVEKAYEDELHGIVGYQQVETNAQGRMLRLLSQTSPSPGQDLYLTIDMDLQRAAELALGEFNGAVVALDPGNGDVLAMVSQPGYDPNLFVKGINRDTFKELNTSPDRPLFNRALRGTYPPGSTIKPFVGIAGLSYGLVDPASTTYCPGFYKLPNVSRRYRDWKRWGHGRVNLKRSIVESCDVYFYELGHRMGIERLHDFLARFGLGGRTGLDIGYERTGILPNEQWKRAVHGQPWYTGETLIAAIGQGFMLTTPLQLAHATGILARRGAGVQPRLLMARSDPESGERLNVASRPIEPIDLALDTHWDNVIQGMIDVVHGERGTARRIAPDFPYQIAGKTGTAQVYSLGEHEEYDAAAIEEKLRDHALFISFAPAEAPRVAVAVVVENGGSGGAIAAPVARKVLDAWAATGL